MHIVVPIKQVPETGNVRMDDATGTMIREGVDSIINPLDLYAIEIAIQLAETYGGTTTAMSMGPPSCRQSLKEAIAMGCDAAVQISDKRFAGADTWATSYVLAETIKQQLGAVDLIICGERATDGDTGQVGPGMAAFLQLPLATYIRRITDIEPGKGFRVERLVEGGHEVLWVPFPALLTVVKEIGFPRLPTLRGKQKARHTTIPVITADSLDIRQERIGLKGSPTRVTKIFRPQVTRRGELHVVKDDADLERAVDRVVDALASRNLI